jgi:NADH-quinone oxidoreductase subunit G
VRFSDEIAGDRFIQLVDRGDGTQILNFADDPFDSVFSGNTVQICPVGALTSKPYRFVSRPWDLATAPSVCGYCSVGCPITNESRTDKLVRCQALPNEQVNDFWICDKGRYGYHYVSQDDRLETPLMRGEDDSFAPAGWGESIARIADRLKSAKNVGVIAGGHLPTEDAFAISKLAKGVIGTADVDSRLQDAGAPYELVTAIGGAAGSTARMKDIESADTIVWVGADPKETLPVLYLHLHKAAKENGANLIVVGPRKTSLDALAKRVVRTYPGREAEVLKLLTGDIPEGKTVVCWGPAWEGRDESQIVEGVVDIVKATGAGFLMCPPHAGSQGMIDMGVLPTLDAGYQPAATPGKDTRAILEAAANKELDVLLLFGADPITDFPDANLAIKALESGVFVVVVELFPTQSAMRADVVLPSTAYAEREGTFTNLERRLQKLESLTPAPGSSKEPWKVCRDVAKALGSDWKWHTFTDIWNDIRKEVPTHKDVDPANLNQEMPGSQPFYATGYAPDTDEFSHQKKVAGPGGQYPKGHRQGAPFQTGQNWPLSWELRAFESKQRPGIVPPSPGAQSENGSLSNGTPRPSAAAPPPGSFALIVGKQLYDEGTMMSHTAHLRAIQRTPFVGMHRDDAAALGVTKGDEVAVTGAGTTVHLPVVIEDIARKTVFIPHHQASVRANTLICGVNPIVEVKKS